MSNNSDTSKIIPTIAGSIAKAGMGLLPGGGVAVSIYELLSLGVEQMAEYMEQRTKQRCEEFHERLIAGEKLDEFTADNLDVEDYHALLSACLGEMETEKAGLYGAMASAIALGRIAPREKRFLMLALKDLSHAQLQMARKAYIAKRNALKPHQGAGQREEGDFLGLRSSDEIEQLNYEALVAAKVVRENKLSPLGETLVRACFDAADLTPSSIGEDVWSPVWLNILSFELAGRALSLASDLGNSAWLKNMRHSIYRPQGRRQFQPYDGLNVLIIDQDPGAVIAGREVLMTDIGKRSLIVVALSEVPAEVKAGLPEAIWFNAPQMSAAALLDLMLASASQRS
ncbi:hypothetical protein ABI582_22940 [Pseudomonas sp. SAS7]|uniref:hypothetical protein n=1 Tax=Pseudomonas sp. SAS7 TaxID=3156487 RepID=UPI003F9A6782